ncbi:SGNH hydrolase-type esterase domain-containing protein [Leucosporidium creatinivorum]|uniref:SGNH hydrolase-type esterase domain-containing protein n=1 Tax=Leucosporidium creatinivorum TaxID=106004 RepID=A0A1Y2EL53_9BASI|nr:SGNH hydrolase-type esterase domain-containing protein [Leucosporidium creatinivorum]
MTGHTPKHEPSVQQDTLIMFGDSITQGAFDQGGTGAALANLYVRAWDVQNRGLGGYNTKWAIPIGKKWLPQVGEDRPRTALMTIWFGANDAVLPGYGQHVPLPDFKTNLHTLITLLRSPTSPYYSPTTSLLLLTPPPVDTARWAAELRSKYPPPPSPTGEEQPLEFDRDPENTRLYAQAVKEVGWEAGVPTVDVWTAIMAKAAEIGEEGLKELLVDGLHLSALGYMVVTDVVKDTIVTHLPDLHWDKVPKHYPPWGEMLNACLGDE